MYNGKKNRLPRKKMANEIFLQNFEKALERSSARMRSYMLLRDGIVVGEKYWPPYLADDTVWVNSISKSFTATAIGFAVQENLLRLSDTVLSFFPEKQPKNPSANLQAMQVQHLLSMSTGHANDTADCLTTSADDDWESILLNQPVPYVPGTHFVYNSGATYLLSAILQLVTGQTLVDYLSSRLFNPLGFGRVYWDSNKQGINIGAWGIMVDLEDIAKLGLLYLNNGKYEGKQILTEEWVRTATAIYADNSHTENQAPDWTVGYGYQFWRCQHNAYRADGAAGQYCVVMPEQNAVLALMSDTNDMQEILDIVWRELLPGLGKGYNELQQKYMNSNWKLEANEFQLEHFYFSFTNNELCIDMELVDGTTSKLCAGNGAWASNDVALPFGTPSLIPAQALQKELLFNYCHFFWIDDATLLVEWCYRNTPFRDKMIITFKNEKAMFILPSKMNALTDTQREVKVSAELWKLSKKPE